MKRRRRRSGALEANDFEELLEVRVFLQLFNGI
jgi:hypothetical protein